MKTFSITLSDNNWNDEKGGWDLDLLRESYFEVMSIQSKDGKVDETNYFENKALGAIQWKSANPKPEHIFVQIGDRVPEEIEGIKDEGEKQIKTVKEKGDKNTKRVGWVGTVVAIITGILGAFGTPEELRNSARELISPQLDSSRTPNVECVSDTIKLPADTVYVTKTDQQTSGETIVIEDLSEKIRQLKSQKAKLERDLEEEEKKPKLSEVMIKLHKDGEEFLEGSMSYRLSKLGFSVVVLKSDGEERILYNPRNSGELASLQTEFPDWDGFEKKDVADPNIIEIHY